MKGSDKSVMKLALKDISAFIQSKYSHNEMFTHYSIHDIDSWFCTPDFLYTKQAVRLNRLLGLHKINKQNNINNLKQTK